MTDERTLTCPKCRQTMRQLEVSDAIVDRCEKCYGIWLDKDERLRLQIDKEAARVLDVGPSANGDDVDRPETMICPRCGAELHHHRHPAQSHITLDVCRECHGAFYDAGELRDLTEFTFVERIREFFGR